jgi:NADH-quinone oxidoreductase subunit H
MAAIQFIQSLWFALPEQLRELIVILVQILPLTVTVILCVAFLTYFERKIIGYMQIRVGPNRVGPTGWFQPFADTIKLIIKEVVIPANANRFLFVVAPLLSIVPALAAWAVVPLFPGYAIARHRRRPALCPRADLAGVYGIILAGWASNSKYALLGAMRSAAQIVAYEIAMGFALVGVLMASGSMNLGVKIVEAQSGGVLSWFWLPLFPLFVVYFISGRGGNQSRAI